MNCDIVNEYNIDVTIDGLAVGCENYVCIPYNKDNNNDDVSHISSLLDGSNLIWSNLISKDTNDNHNKIEKILFRIVKIHPYNNNNNNNNNNIKIFIVSKEILEFVRINFNCRFYLNFSSIYQDIKDIIRDNMYIDWYKVPIVKYIRLTKIQYTLPSNINNIYQDSVLKINDT